MADEIPRYPQRDVKDHLQGGVQVVVNLVPWVGGVAAQAIGHVVTPSVERRRDIWFETLADVVSELQERQVTPEKLAEDEEWISAVAQASRVAMGTHLEEKLQMLQKLLTTLALDADRDAVVVGRFIRYIEEFEPVHFLVLQYASNPEAYLKRIGVDKSRATTSRKNILRDHAEIPINEASLDIVLADLDRQGLIQGSMVTGLVRDPTSAFISDLGRELLAWTWAFK